MINIAKLKADYVINAEGLLCPMPVLKLAKKASQAEKDTVIELCATDPMAPIDAEHFCAQKGYEFLGKSVQKISGIDVFSIKIRVV